MRGKTPKERKSYILRMGGGTLVEVTREVYLEWYQSRRRERYQQERKQKYGVCSLEELEEKGTAIVSVTDSLEETAIREMCVEKLREVMDGLPEDDAYLLYLLFFEELSVKDVAQICGCSRKTVENRRRRILQELNEKMREMGITGGCF
ncbi:MAG: sigma-70 family RNA polymerase sigma factor [Eubacteriales bacterium]|nr:sigma-70 family RNA polymerase sigma factor [Eubacteriales bacterium]